MSENTKVEPTVEPAVDDGEAADMLVDYLKGSPRAKVDSDVGTAMAERIVTIEGGDDEKGCVHLEHVADHARHLYVIAPPMRADNALYAIRSIIAAAINKARKPLVEELAARQKRLMDQDYDIKRARYSNLELHDQIARLEKSLSGKATPNQAVSVPTIDANTL